MVLKILTPLDLMALSSADCQWLDSIHLFRSKSECDSLKSKKQTGETCTFKAEEQFYEG